MATGVAVGSAMTVVISIFLERCEIQHQTAIILLLLAVGCCWSEWRNMAFSNVIWICQLFEILFNYLTLASWTNTTQLNRNGFRSRQRAFSGEFWNSTNSKSMGIFAVILCYPPPPSAPSRLHLLTFIHLKPSPKKNHWKFLWDSFREN